MNDMKDLLSCVCDLAVDVGLYQAEQRKTFSRDSIETKRSHDYVSYVDKESERMIVETLRNLLPQAGFVTEEKTINQNDEAEYKWIIDPLDGTTNFIHDISPWCVSIALLHENVSVLGVVYEVTLKELFYASKGNGAWLRTDGGKTKRLQVSPVDNIDQALICIGHPYDAEDFRTLCTLLTSRLYGRCASIRSLGSAAAELCYVAANRLDVYVESFLNSWDVSAGAIILSEAGGNITDYNNEDELWRTGKEVLATNGLLHTVMINEISTLLHNNNQ